MVARGAQPTTSRRRVRGSNVELFPSLPWGRGWTAAASSSVRQRMETREGAFRGPMQCVTTSHTFQIALITENPVGRMTSALIYDGSFCRKLNATVAD